MTFVAMAISLVQALSDTKSKGDLSHVVVVVLFLWLIALLIGRFAQPSKTEWKTEVLEDMNMDGQIEERIYHEVEFLGKKPAIMNLSDSRWYVDMGNGAMVSYNRIRNEGMCRMCDQFKDGEKGDTIHVYRVQKDKPHFWNAGPVYFFSKHPDLFLQGSQPMEVIVGK